MFTWAGGGGSSSAGERVRFWSLEPELREVNLSALSGEQHLIQSCVSMTTRPAHSQSGNEDQRGWNVVL